MSKKCNWHSNCGGHSLGNFGPTMTKQSFKEECDINEILKRARNGQDISKSINTREAQYGDFSNVPDFQEALNVVNNAQNMFMELGAEVRERFMNDPGRMVAFLQDPKNDEESYELGLRVRPEPKVTPVKVEPKAPAAPAADASPSLPAAPAAGSVVEASGKQ